MGEVLAEEAEAANVRLQEEKAEVDAEKARKPRSWWTSWLFSSHHSDHGPDTT